MKEQLQNLYNSFRLGDDMLLVKLDKPVKLTQGLLISYFIEKAWINSATFKKLTIKERLTLQQTIEAFQFIHGVAYLPDENAIVFSYDFWYDSPIESNNIEEMEKEYNNINLIINHVNELVKNI